MTLLNQDLFYLKYGNSRQKKYTLSLHKFSAVPFPDNDVEERTSRWVNKHIKKFNLNARFSVEHWKNIWAKQFHIMRQKEQRENPERLYSYSKIIKVIRTSYELGHEQMFITKIILGMKSYQQNVNLTAPTITFPGIEEYELFTITPEHVIGMIYENSKKEKRVMIHKEIHKFCDATLKRVLEGLEKYNKDVKYGYAIPSPSDADAEYLRFYEEDIKECLKHHDQMRCWEMHVNGRPLGSRRDRPI
ncbi:hypothetical protein Tco_0999670 [Tanacetum coccineum]